MDAQSYKVRSTRPFQDAHHNILLVDCVHDTVLIQQRTLGFDKMEVGRVASGTLFETCEAGPKNGQSPCAFHHVREKASGILSTGSQTTTN